MRHKMFSFSPFPCSLLFFTWKKLPYWINLYSWESVHLWLRDVIFHFFPPNLVCHHYLNSGLSKRESFCQLWPDTCFCKQSFTGIQTHPFISILWVTGWVVMTETIWAAGLETLTSGPSQQTFADLCSNPGKEVKVATVITCGNISTVAAVGSFYKEIRFLHLFWSVCWIWKL